MASAIEPGMWVECVRESVVRPGVLMVGSVYRVDRIIFGPFPGGYKGVGVHLVGVNTSNPFGWQCDLFRPIGRDNPDLIESLKQPAPAAVRELIGAEG